MNIIYLRRIGQTYSTALRCLRVSIVVGVVAIFGLGMTWVGYQIGVGDTEFPEHQLVASLKQTFAKERQLLNDAKTDTQGGIDALAIRLGQLQSQLLRLDALGERLVDMGGLDKNEFSFDMPPALGGPEAIHSLSQQSALPELLLEMEHLEQMIGHRQQQLMLVEDLIMNSNLEDSVHPTGRPVQKGWISSYFGMRNDPFTGKRSMHKGIDFAGKDGSGVVAVAAGIVTWAVDRHGFGNLIEINHGKGYITRYGHNKKILVGIGDRIKQGQIIAEMGSTGRSTGPHVHFEVLRNNKTIDPAKYILTKRNQ
ncbi:MAG: M23 family metallopeptidase [Candidatus Thiodiazotropha sp. (ex Lucinoma aequizonata)]|nr:M23 family metallopeptidase [Candidatus Thiodiazotropha sp. (ex Lucinoma aequizonata)]MCU7886852.1 M23 family metallopeptidase [Candidatus Thiodiazotropha sp. (ex Lucinoma aequizonata)]MCU7896120.1 M23 family metallopeptidase [Candidatus Thiodiazotropha sp. (ex Lucinoma aequizonata)]MCU7900287.1 M23 family metallopeptidase [Candidatus Thiodiazotropha sp. (ex Lucinoma aequizonata)]MCU7902429.1 M23 family metallopeptidase [Candidatus Thiodiazotropha sp. (ex Lucinoma aequizonata)]